MIHPFSSSRLLPAVRLAFACLTAALLCQQASAVEPRQQPAPVVLISMDGFRWDYLERYAEQTPHLRQLARDGVAAHSLVPVFPSNTFPNHYTLVTGLYPSHSGIINNRMFDPNVGEAFSISRPEAAQDSRWWGGEPVWITAVLQGKTSVCSFWPGSEAEIKGVRATRWKPYDYSIPFDKRLDELVGWLKQDKPAIATFYFEESNSVGHRAGPESEGLALTLKMLDDRVATMLKRFESERLAVNLVLVSDHGMAPCKPDQVVLFDDYIDLNLIQIDFDEAVCGVRPAVGADVAKIVEALSRMPHAKVYRAEDLPPKLHIDPRNPRVPPIWILPDEGWHVMRRSVYAQARERMPQGQHGYDPALPSMHGVFIANGPAFRKGVKIPTVENIHVYNLLCAAAGLKPAPNDGDDRLVKAVLK